MATASACGSGSAGGTGPGTTAPTTALDGRAFTSTTVTEDGAPRPLVDDTVVTLSFHDDALTVNVGCNTMGGPVTTTDGALRLGPDMGSTAMGCDEERMDQDGWISSFLTATPVWTLDGDTLTITGGTTTIVLVDESVTNPDRPLVGTTWILESIVTGDTTSSVPNDVIATLDLTSDGSAVGTGTCNGYGATYTTAEDTITFEPRPTTLIGCPGSQPVVESAVGTTLAGEVSYTIDGDVVTFSHPDGHGLVYRAEP